MSFWSRLLFLGAVVSGSGLAANAGCSAGSDPDGSGGASSGVLVGPGGGIGSCPACEFNIYVECDGTRTDCGLQDLVCAPTLGCAACAPGARTCVGNEVHECTDDGEPAGPVVETCDVNAGLTCSNGACKTGCEVAEDQPSNVGCEFWAVDLDQQDGVGDPASEPWGVALSNAGSGQANVTIELNNAAPGAPQDLMVVQQVSVPAGSLNAVILPTRELDCGTVPNDYNSPGTCLSSRAYRITSSSPIVVYQFNVFENAYSNDASLLLPTNALGNQYRVIGWSAGHPIKFTFPGAPNILDRSYVTVVGTKPNTTVTVKPSWRIKGNAPIAATGPGGTITVTLNPFDVLNLETDDGTTSDNLETIADLSGTFVYSDQPVAVFSGVESTGAPGYVDIPTYPGWDSNDTCCLDHLEDQLFPIESVGTNYVVTRSPVRSTSSYREPDVIRFVGAAEVANVTTTLPAPFASFTLQPGEVKTTWAQDNFTATGDKPFLIGQIQISNNYVDGPYIGDPSLTIVPPVEQQRTEYVIPTPGSWDQNWVVICAEVGSNIMLDGNSTASCATEPAGTVLGVAYESRKCALSVGAHSLTGDKRFGIMAYGYGSAGSYAFAGGADVRKIYVPPVPQ